MIAVVKRWPAVISALLFFLSLRAAAADDPAAAARELARKSVAFAGKGAPVTVIWRSLSTEPVPLAARTAFEAALLEAGIKPGDPAPTADLHLTLSENGTQFVLIEEAIKGDERQVWIAAWKRSETAGAPTAAAATLEKKLLWEQDEQILDVAFPPAGMLVLAPSGVALYTRNGSRWESKRTVPIAAPKPWPRDLRGHLRTKGATFQALLPGMVCDGTTDPALALDCHASDDPWVLESGSRDLLLAAFHTTRNYFDGRVTTQAGQRKTVPPFFSAASAGNQGDTVWLLATVEGKVQMLDSSLELAGLSNVFWGSDIAGTAAHCGAGSQILATRPGDPGQPDSVQAFALNGRALEPVTDAAELPGPVLALWTSGGAAATAVVHDLRTGKYAAYSLSVVCGG